jgi:outer membrane protein OmpA-like peptidoglycan-associated protein
MVPGDVLFTSGSAVVTPAGRALLRQVATSVDATVGTVTIVGHTDSIGGSGYNLTLSRRRARAVADTLADFGIRRNRMRTMGRGESEPIAPNTTVSGRTLNRRVEIYLPASGQRDQ